MKEYEVVVTIEKIATHLVEADSPEEAKVKALQFNHVKEESTDSEHILCANDVEELRR